MEEVERSLHAPPVTPGRAGVCGGRWQLAVPSAQLSAFPLSPPCPAHTGLGFGSSLAGVQPSLCGSKGTSPRGSKVLSGVVARGLEQGSRLKREAGGQRRL